MIFLLVYCIVVLFLICGLAWILWKLKKIDDSLQRMIDDVKKTTKSINARCRRGCSDDTSKAIQERVDKYISNE